MKKLNEILAILPIALIAGGCATNDITQEPSDPGRINMLMSVLPSGAGQGNTEEGTKEEHAFSESCLYVATYNADGTKKESLITAGVKSTDPEVKLYNATWGPTIAARLNADDYADAFIGAAFSLPPNATDGFTIADLTDESSSRIIKWPGDGTGNTFTPKDDGVHLIPMAGFMSVPAGYLNTERRAPDIEMTRAMAKIIIEDPYDILENVTLDCPDKGFLWPSTADWLAGNASVPAVPSTGVSKITQTLTPAQTSEIAGIDGADGKAYTFYTFEQDFTDKAANHDDRKIITLTASELSGIKDVSGNPKTMRLSFAPHDDGAPDTSYTITSLNSGYWRGVMRNHIYTFTIGLPTEAGISLKVSVSKWNKETQQEDL